MNGQSYAWPRSSRPSKVFIDIYYRNIGESLPVLRIVRREAVLLRQSGPDAKGFRGHLGGPELALPVPSGYNANRYGTGLIFLKSTGFQP